MAPAPATLEVHQTEPIVPDAPDSTQVPAEEWRRHSHGERGDSSNRGDHSSGASGGSSGTSG